MTHPPQPTGEGRKETITELKKRIREDLQSIIEFVGGTDHEVTQYVREMKRHY